MCAGGETTELSWVPLVPPLYCPPWVPPLKEGAASGPPQSPPGPPSLPKPLAESRHLSGPATTEPFETVSGRLWVSGFARQELERLLASLKGSVAFAGRQCRIRSIRNIMSYKQYFLCRRPCESVVTKARPYMSHGLNS